MSPRTIARTTLALLLAAASGLATARHTAAQDLGTVEMVVRQGESISTTSRIILTGPPLSDDQYVGSCKDPTGTFPACQGILFQERLHGYYPPGKVTLWILGNQLPIGLQLGSFAYRGVCANGITAWDKYIATILPPRSSGPDADLDALSDEDEALFGTDPCLADSDADGLLDGTEFELSIAEGWGAADPLNGDSDGDGLSDGHEVTVVGTSPGKADTDGDRIPDGFDPHPLLPDAIGGYVEEAARWLSLEVAALDPALFTGPNPNARQGRRNGLTTTLQSAANLAAGGQVSAARTLLASVQERLDGAAAPEDWMLASSPTTELATHVALLIELIESP